MDTSLFHMTNQDGVSSSTVMSLGSYVLIRTIPTIPTTRPQDPSRQDLDSTDDPCPSFSRRSGNNHVVRWCCADASLLPDGNHSYSRPSLSVLTHSCLVDWNGFDTGHKGVRPILGVRVFGF